MIYLVLGFIGLLIGVLGIFGFGWFYGTALGLLVAEAITLRRRLSRLEKSMEAKPAAVETPLVSVPGQKKTPAAPAAEPEPAPTPDDTVGDAEDDDIYIAEAPIPPKITVSPVAAPSPASASGVGSEKPGATDHSFPLGDYVKRFFTTGNVVTKIGIIVLFFGFAFLLKYAAQRNMVPIQFRLIGVFLGGMGLLGVGWRLRDRKLMYGLLLQGCGIGVLYLTVFAAARFYDLLPYGLAFVVMFCLVVLSGILSVLQDAKYLAVSGIVGGFLAPVLMSTGAGSHVVLFSYYALLNLGIVGIAWHKAWRELNLIGFIFTFVIASIWGGRYYQPRYFTSTEPFLILFFLYYVAVSVLYALRQPLNLRGFVDGALVFGVPLVAFGLQSGLVRNFEYGLAISALGLGLFYIILAAVLRRRRIDGLQMVIDSFLAFGIVFGSLAIPLALDGRWTSAAWAIEGSAILWIGIRQHRLLQRLFGILLQAGAGLFFLVAVYLPYQRIPVVNSFFIGCILISLAGLFSSWYMTKRTGVLREWERPAEILLMIWGIIWWFGGALWEINRFVSPENRIAAVLVHAAVSFMLMDGVSRGLAWKQFAYPALLLLPMMGIAAVHPSFPAERMHLFNYWNAAAWLIGLGVQYRLLFNREKTWPEKLVPLWHQCTLWLLIFILAREGSWLIDLLLRGEPTWRYCAWGAVPGVLIFAMISRGALLSWPIRRFQEAYLGWGTALPMVCFFVWTLLMNFYRADPAPLPYFPVVNPAEITQLFLLVLIFRWIGSQEVWTRKLDGVFSITMLKMIVACGGFFLLNAVVARTIHFWTHVPYTAEGLYRSVLFQASISILWGVTALLTTIGAARKFSRPAWIAGACILSLVVIKLFIIDLSGTGTIARIVSFLGVGSLMLLIGYFSPIPPARAKEVP